MTGIRVLSRCEELARISSRAGRIDRFHLTPEHARANALVAQWLTEAGLRSWQDAAGNVCGRREGPTAGAPALLLGSHLDTVPNAGRYDGPLGVALAVEVAERLRDAALPFALEVIGFADEEGTRFGTALLGSSAVAGRWQPAWDGLVDAEGVTLAEAAAAFGLRGSARSAGRRHDELVGYLEAHIEQGPLLEAAGLGLGEVRSIAAARRARVTLEGEARHAGGTPYDRRRDALLGASTVVLAVERISRRRGAVGTVGQLTVQPGAVNVVPGRVDLSIDLRAETDRELDDAWAEIAAAIAEASDARGLRVGVAELHRAAAVPCSAELRAAVRSAVTEVQPTCPSLLSWAGHDAMALATVTDVGMLFVRCAGGVSHAPEESVTAADAALAADALQGTVLEIARARFPDFTPAQREAR